MEKQYNPVAVEDKIYQEWLEKEYFRADVNSEKEPYSIVIPPPNVTGILHMGHALNNTIQDILIRYKRMKGFEALWIPGTDHAGIATQNVVERKLAGEGKTRHDIGREKFVEEVWKWKKDYHATITNQLKKLGSSCDWSRERFTMDEGLSKAVRKVFVKLYEDDLIYRGKYIINWCPRCHTALADEESEHHEHASHLWHFKYPLSDGSGYLTVATTRPETMLGDTAVAVNPKDERYKDIIGKKLTLPLVNREIPVIADDFVSREFGTGAVKVTPAHDPNDFQMGLRHDMTPIVVMDGSGKMIGDIPERYVGMDRFECRKAVVEDMDKAGFLVKIEDHTHSVGHCYRCDTIVEPYYSDQWFVRMKPLAEKALSAAVNDEIKFYPERWKKTYIDWMENIRDWCISRQIWWGHRIPVWYCDNCGKLTVSEEDATCCLHCKSENIHQDEDVLDTWFSSWLWPFSTMNWPDGSAELEKFYPTDVLVTAPEILFFWVARMLMSGLYFTGKLPFTDIVLHGTVRDKTGRKMSKSLGNSIDPLDIIKDYGTDALRFSMMTITAQGADVYLGKDTFDIGRNFANKIWNASRFFLENIEGKLRFDTLPNPSLLKNEDKWILSRLNGTVKSVEDSIASYNFNEACHTLYDFMWHDFCDWYIESKKPDMYQSDDVERRETAFNVICYTLANTMKLLHPVMPFLTEEIWKHIKDKVDYSGVTVSESIMLSAFPSYDEGGSDTELESNFSIVTDVITALRTIRSENNIPPDKKGSAVIIPNGLDASANLNDNAYLIKLFAKLDNLTISVDADKPEFSGQSVVKGSELYLDFGNLIDKKVETERLEKEIAKLKKFAEGVKRKLSNEAFVSKAPEAVIAKERAKEIGLLENIEKLEKNLENLR